MATEQNARPFIECLEDDLRTSSLYEPSLQLELLHYAQMLQETTDPNWVDLMVWRLHKENVEQPRTVQILAARTAHSRLLGAGSRNVISKVFKEHTRDLAMSIMASRLKIDGAAGAAQFASKTVHEVCGHALAPSTLESEFPSYDWPAKVFLEDYEKMAALNSPAEEAKLITEVAKLRDRAGTRR